jgi:hypothetical protein
MDSAERIAQRALDELAPARARHAGLKSGIVNATFATPRHQFIQPGMRRQIGARHVPSPIPVRSALVKHLGIEKVPARSVKLS